MCHETGTEWGPMSLEKTMKDWRHSNEKTFCRGGYNILGRFVLQCSVEWVRGSKIIKIIKMDITIVAKVRALLTKAAIVGRQSRRSCRNNIEVKLKELLDKVIMTWHYCLSVELCPPK